MPKKRIPTPDETAILVEARGAIADGTASLDLIEQAYRIVERYDYDKADDSILDAAVTAGITQVFFLEREANGIDG